MMKPISLAAISIIHFAGLFLPAFATDYILGSGDQISVKIHNIEGFDSISYVLPDGKINLVRIDPLLIKGKTLTQAKSLIENAYKIIFKVPVVSVELVEPRTPVVSIDGAINKPGIYAVESETNILKNWPRVSDAIEIAGGVKDNGDLSSIKLTRFNSNDNNRETINIDLSKVITSGSSDSNINILNNDRIYVPIQKVGKNPNDNRFNTYSTLSPLQINVLVAGEVNSPGRIELRPDRGIQTAIYAAGGLNNKSSDQILLIRLNKTYFEEQIPIRMKYLEDYRLGSRKNPILREGDILIIGKNWIAKVSEAINTGLSPLGPIIDAASIFRILGM